MVGGYDSGRFGIWEKEKEKPSVLLKSDNEPILAIEVNTNGNKAVTISQNGLIAIWDLEKRKQSKKFNFNKHVSALTLGPKDQVAVGFEEGNLAVWDAVHDPHYLEGHERRITDSCYFTQWPGCFSCRGS